MSWLAEIFRDGGPFMFPLVALFILGLPLGVARVVAARWTRAPGLGLVSVGLLVCLGLVGTLQGLVLATEAVAHASPEFKGVLLDQGLRIALVTTWTGLVLGGLLVPVHGVAALLERRATRSRLGTVALVGAVVVFGLCLATAGLLVVALAGVADLRDGYLAGLEAAPHGNWIHGVLVTGVVLGGCTVLLALPAGLLSLVVAVTGLVRRDAQPPGDSTPG